MMHSFNALFITSTPSESETCLKKLYMEAVYLHSGVEKRVCFSNNPRNGHFRAIARQQPIADFHVTMVTASPAQKTARADNYFL